VEYESHMGGMVHKLYRRDLWFPKEKRGKGGGGGKKKKPKNKTRNKKG